MSSAKHDQHKSPTPTHPTSPPSLHTACRVCAGDVLFVPAYTWHNVHSLANADGVNLGVNFWFTAPAEKVRREGSRDHYRNLQNP